MKCFLLALALSAASLNLSGQPAWTSVFRPLTIGDTIPDMPLGPIINYRSSTTRLSDFNDKLLLLDFWATWCTNCIQGFGKLESLQTQFADRLQVLLVNARSSGDTYKKVSTFFSRRLTKNGKKFSLPSLVEDTVLKQLFMHSLIPHYVWIYKGKVQAITGAEEVTAENVAKVLAQEDRLAVKKDLDPEQPLFAMATLPRDKLVQYSIFLKGRYNGLPSGSRLRMKDTAMQGISMTNATLAGLYEAVGMALLPGFDKKKFILELPDSSALLAPKGAGLEEREEWYRVNLYSYDLILPGVRPKNIYWRMLADLNSHSEYEGRVEKRVVDCWVVEKASRTRRREASEKVMNGKTVVFDGLLENFVGDLNQLPFIRPFIVNGIGKAGPVKLVIMRALTNWAILKEEMARNGLVLREGKREMEVFVVRKKSD